MLFPINAAVGDFVVHPADPRVGMLKQLDGQFAKIQYDKKEFKKYAVSHPLTSMIRKVTEAEFNASTPYLLWIDPDTGLETKLDKKFLRVIDLLKVGRESATTSSKLLALLGEKDNDSNRRQLRGAIDYFLHEKDILICVATSLCGGYFIAGNAAEVQEAIADKLKKADSLQRSAMKLLKMAERFSNDCQATA